MEELISKPVYLHFFDKELLSSLGVERYAENLTESFLKDFVLSMFSIKERAYLSGAQIFDNNVANTIYLKYYELFNSYGWIDLYSNTFSLKDLFAQKREQYPKGDGKRNIYLQDNWKYYLEFEPNLVYNYYDTTNILEGFLNQDFSNNYLDTIAEKVGTNYCSKELNKIVPYLDEITHNRGKKAITKFLYLDKLLKVNASDNVYRLLTLNISERYTQTYLGYEEGTVITGLSCHLDYYDHLTDTFPYYDLRIWRRVYSLMGCEKFIYKMGGGEICRIRNDGRYYKFISTIRKAISVFIEEYDKQEVKRSILYYGQKKLRISNNKINFINRNMEAYLEFYEKEITSIDEFLEILRINYIKITKELLIKSNEGSVGRMIDPRNIFVIYGRNLQAKEDLFDLLRAVDLKPFEWSTVVELTGEGCPTNYQSIDKAMDNVQAFIALFTPDDEVKLRDELLDKGEKEEIDTHQPRPNVLFETGLAFGKDRKKTIIVEVGKIRRITDLDGFNTIRLDGSLRKRKELIKRLQTLNCKIDTTSDWEEKKYKSGI